MINLTHIWPNTLITKLTPGLLLIFRGRNVVPRDQWKDELHPDTDGFKRVANKFNEKITDLFS